jgi:hypothetical protein
MQSHDTDFRYMAINDLITELNCIESGYLDENVERRIVPALLKLVDDKNGEVQNMAIKW